MTKKKGQHLLFLLRYHYSQDAHRKATSPPSCHYSRWHLKSIMYIESVFITGICEMFIPAECWLLFSLRA